MDLKALEIAPQVATATFTTAAVDSTDAEAIDASLNIHAYLRTAFAGANNDLDIIARNPGPTASATGSSTMTGANNDVTFTAAAAGASFNGWRIRFLAGGVSQAASIVVNSTTREIEVFLATDASGNPTTTSSAFQTLWGATGAATAVATVANSGGDTGAGVMTAFDAVTLAGGVGGTSHTVTFTVAGNNTPLTVTSVGLATTVNVATGAGGAATSTAAQVAAAINSDPVVSRVLLANIQAGNDGTGVVVAAGSAPLVGPAGTTPTLDVTLQTDHGDANWRSVKAFGQKTTLVVPDRDTFGVVGDRLRWNVVIAGTTPVFALSIGSITQTTVGGTRG